MNLKITCCLVLLTLMILPVTAQTIWNGPVTSFSKADFADWTLPANQDQITSNVAITRRNSQGLFNIVTETSYVTDVSPADTEWAFGTTAEIGTLNFADWRTTTTDNNPYGDHTNLVGHDMVVHLISEDIYFDLVYTSWTSGGNGGGFAYNRTTDSGLSISEEAFNKIKAFPIPADEYINIINLREPQTLVVFDLMGKKLLEVQSEGTDLSMDISSLSKGIYLIKTESKGTLKFIKN